IRRDRLETQLLNALETRILRPDMTAYLMSRFEQQLRAKLTEMGHGDYASGRVAMERQREELRTQAKRISAAIGHGGNLESLLDHLTGLESEIATLSRKIEAYKPLDLTVTTENARRFAFENVLSLLSPVRNVRSSAGFVVKPLAGTRYSLYSSF
ncbi:MAG TPA: hypothetical protein VMQ86_12455, partial [Bryobacteraceae bacterium]|nr:hypothetical protein [Bryobacteraceae bacterium]